MGVTPQYQGKYGRPWTISLNTDSGADNITGIPASAISVIVRNVNAQTEVASTGAIQIVTTNPAVITWQPTATDYAVTGSFQAIPEIMFSTGPEAYDPIPFQVLARQT